jgi:hydrogenase/urease accessory protein HupE
VRYLVRFRNVRFSSLIALVFCLFATSAWAHEISFSHGTVQLGNPIQISLELPLRDLAVALETDEQSLLKSTGVIERQSKIERLLIDRFAATSGNTTLNHQDFKLEPVIDGKNVRVSFSLASSGQMPSLNVHLFPENNLHKTFLDVYENGILERQVILDATQTTLELQTNTRQSIPEVVWNFLLEGVHHIFIGPDHILFVIGLLLLGGTLGQLLKIVSAFTISHSITLALATLHILNPPSSLIEPAIAASIVFVGIDSLRASRFWMPFMSKSWTMRKSHFTQPEYISRQDSKVQVLTHRDTASKNARDLRVYFALAFGLIHGFGFANALAEMQLPQDALAWSLFAFNAGVEVGQACIVLAVAPILALMRSKLEPVLAGRIIGAGSLVVIAAGTVWFIERVRG